MGTLGIFHRFILQLRPIAGHSWMSLARGREKRRIPSSGSIEADDDGDDIVAMVVFFNS